MKDGNLTKALGHCEEALRRFAGNTPVYELKSRILQRMARQSVEEGLAQEPRDKRLQLTRALFQKLADLRRDFCEGSVSIDEFVEQVGNEVDARTAEFASTVAEFESSARDALPEWEEVSQLARKFLSTGECLLRIVPPALDHAPAAIEFCKAVEVEVGRW